MVLEPAEDKFMNPTCGLGPLSNVLCNLRFDIDGLWQQNLD